MTKWARMNGRIADELGEAFVPGARDNHKTTISRKRPVAQGYVIVLDTLYDGQGARLCVLRLQHGKVDTGISVMADAPNAEAILTEASWTHASMAPPGRKRGGKDGPPPARLYGNGRKK